MIVAATLMLILAASQILSNLGVMPYWAPFSVIRFLNLYFFFHHYWAGADADASTGAGFTTNRTSADPLHVVVRYEDLLERPLEELTRIVDTCGMEFDSETLAASITAHPPHTTTKTGASFSRFAAHEIEWMLSHPEHGSFLRSNGYLGLMEEALRVATNFSTSNRDVRVADNTATRDLAEIARRLRQGEDLSVFELMQYPGAITPNLVSVISSAGRWEVIS